MPTEGNQNILFCSIHLLLCVLFFALSCCILSFALSCCILFFAPAVGLDIHLAICLAVQMAIHLAVHQDTCLAVCLPGCLAVYLAGWRPFVWPLFWPFIWPLVWVLKTWSLHLRPLPPSPLQTSNQRFILKEDNHLTNSFETNIFENTKERQVGHFLIFLMSMVPCMTYPFSS